MKHPLFTREGSSCTRWFLGLLLVGLLLVFLLPYRVPVPLAWSDSYLFGYSNRTGEALFLLLALCLFVVAKVCGLVLPAASREPGPGGDRSSYRLLFAALALSTVIAFLLYLLTHAVGGLNDGAYFLDRIHLIERGQTPYRDFEFAYGDFSLYGAIFLGRLLATGAVNGYYLLWLLETLVGVWFLWIFLRWIDLPCGGRRTVFLITYSLTLLYLASIGLNYCALRYTLPLFGIVAVCRLDRGSGGWHRFGTSTLAVLLVVALLGLSPEEGIAFACATVLYLPLRRFCAGRPFLGDLACLLPVLLGTCFIASQVGIFGTMKSFAAGALNLPIFPAPHILFFFAAFLGLVCVLATGDFKQQAQSNVCFLVLYGFGMAPGALGRCDTTHVAGYEMGILLAAVLFCWRWPIVWRLAAWSLALLFVVLPFAVGIIFSPPTYTKAFLTQLYSGGAPQSALGRKADRFALQLAVQVLGPERGLAKMQGLRASVAARSLDPSVVFAQSSPRVAVPLGYLPNKLSNYNSPTVDEGYFMGLLNLVSPPQVEQKIAELQIRPQEDLVVSPEGLQQCLVQSGSRATMEQLFLIPYAPAPKHQVALFVPLCTYIESNYHYIQQPSPLTFGYGLMRRNQGVQIP